MQFGNHSLFSSKTNITLTHLAVVKPGLFMIHLCTKVDNMVIIVVSFNVRFLLPGVKRCMCATGC